MNDIERQKNSTSLPETLYASAINISFICLPKRKRNFKNYKFPQFLCGNLETKKEVIKNLNAKQIQDSKLGKNSSNEGIGFESVLFDGTKRMIKKY